MAEILVKDAMVPVEEYSTVSQEASLYDAIVELEAANERKEDRKTEHRSVMVYNDDKKVIGVLTYRDILRGLEPNYRKIGDVDAMARFGLSMEFVNFLQEHFGLWEGTFRDLCQRALQTKVKDVLEDPGPHLYVDEQTNILDAVHQLMVGSCISLLVTRGDEVVGILRMIDAFNVVCDEIKLCKP